MPFTREQAYEALASLRPAAVFLQSYQTKHLPENLEIYFGPPEEFFLAPDTQQTYTNGRLIPILDDGNFGLVTFLDPDAGSLIQIDVESPGTSRATFHSWPQYLADLMIQMGESVEDDEQLQRIARLVEFGRIERLFEFFDQSADLVSEDYEAARREFIASISTETGGFDSPA